MKLLIAALPMALFAACYDPVHQDDVKSLGGEAPGVPEGPLHRPGQHCTTCHGGDGPGSPEFSIAGTIYAVKGQPEPAVQARVTIIDKIGSKFTVLTNSVGNFYVPKETWDPIFPVRVHVDRPDGKPGAQQMQSSIGRDGGCGDCHRSGGKYNLMPQVYLDLPQP